VRPLAYDGGTARRFSVFIIAAGGIWRVRIGQTSVVHFGSELLASLAGFLATLYIARELGSGTLGTYALFVAVLIWLKTIFGSGLHQAVTKRVSEGDGGTEYFGAGVVIQTAVFLALIAGLVVARQLINDYLGFPGAALLGLALGVVLAYSLVTAALNGAEKVHIAALLQPLDRMVQSGVQLAVVFFGLLGGGIAGLVWGYVVGAGVAACAGALLLSLRPALPTRDHLSRVLEFTRYSWLSGIEGRSFSAMDTVVLGLFVTSSFIGFYEVAWNLASLLAIFGNSIAEALFPTISKLDNDAEYEAIRDLVGNGLTYTGLFLIPGLIGVLFIGDALLAIYGPEFQRATTVLAILVAARLVYAYEAQLVNALNAIDYPEVAFRVNIVFIAANVSLNLVLVYLYGWVGAAVGTALAAVVGLVAAYYALTDVITVNVPIGEIARQFAAAGVMGLCLYPTRGIIFGFVRKPLLQAFVLVAFGAAVYFAALILLSTRFRTTVQDNIAL